MCICVRAQVCVIWSFCHCFVLFGRVLLLYGWCCCCGSLCLQHSSNLNWLLLIFGCTGVCLHAFFSHSLRTQGAWAEKEEEGEIWKCRISYVTYTLCSQIYPCTLYIVQERVLSTYANTHIRANNNSKVATANGNDSHSIRHAPSFSRSCVLMLL